MRKLDLSARPVQSCQSMLASRPKNVACTGTQRMLLYTGQRDEGRSDHAFPEPLPEVRDSSPIRGFKRVDADPFRSGIFRTSAGIHMFLSSFGSLQCIWMYEPA